MVIRGQTIEAQNGRKPYPLGDVEVVARHFVVRETTPQNPFKPHKHDKSELWYVIEGEAIVTLDGQEQRVKAGDLVVLEPWVEHGLRTEDIARWICLG